MTSRTLARARGPLAAASLAAALALTACSTGSAQGGPTTPAPSSSSTSPSPSSGGTTATPSAQPAEDGPRPTAGGLSVLQPEGWQGGRTDPASIDATLSSLDPQVAQALEPQVRSAAGQGVAGLLVDFGGVQSGDASDIATFSVVDVPAGPIDQVVAGLEQAPPTAGPR